MIDKNVCGDIKNLRKDLIGGFIGGDFPAIDYEKEKNALFDEI